MWLTQPFVTAQTLSKPLDSIDFSDGDWFFIFCDHVATDTLYNYQTQGHETCWCIDDPEVLSNFKSDFQCDLDEQSDGWNEDVVWLYRDGIELERFIYPDSGYMKFGKLTEFTNPIVRKDYWITSHEKYAQKINKLKKEDAYLLLSRDPALPHRFEHRIALSYMNINEEGYRHYQKYYPVLEEVKRLFPELEHNDFGHSRTGNGAAKHISFYRIEKDKININRFIGSDVIRYFKDDGIHEIQYRIQAFIKTRKPKRRSLY